MVHTSGAFRRSAENRAETKLSRHDAVPSGRSRSPLKVLATVGLAGLLGFTTVVPAYADSPETQAVTNYTSRTTGTQTVALTSSQNPSLTRSSVDATETPVATTTTTTSTTSKSTSTSTTSTTSSSTTTTSTTPVVSASSSKVEAFLAAALAQVGQNQDCTALVERSLRAIGYSVGDLGPMDFGPYGTAISTSQAQAGDILERSGHVAIYLGDGRAVEGGYYGYMTVVVSDTPSAYSVAIRLGE